MNSKIVYFDNAATTFPKPEEVYDYMDKFYRNFGGNAGHGENIIANKANTIIQETRKRLLNLYHTDNRNVIFSPSATEAINIVLRGIKWMDGMIVYISPFEHNAVLRVLNYIKKLYKIEIYQLSVNPKTLVYDLEKISYDFQDNRPNIVICSHASNVCGVVAPIKELCLLAKKYDALTVVDMAQTCGLLDVNLNDVMADIVVFAGHKTLYGPFGVAGFIMGKNIKIVPLIYGGTGIDSANDDMPAILPERLEAGSMNVLAIAGLNAALKWHEKIGIENILEKEKENCRRLLNVLKKYNFINPMYSEKAEHIGVISCSMKYGIASDNIGEILNKRGIAVRSGLQCAPLAHKFLKTFPDGTVRFSVSYFNKNEDFKKLEEALDYINDNC